MDDHAGFPVDRLWAGLSLLGSSKLLLPAMVFLVILTGRRYWREGVTWLYSVALMDAVILASKVAFFGWGYGLRSIDFTGFSGHVAMAAAFYPVIFVALARRHFPDATGVFAVAGLLIAGVVAISRVQLAAHSVSEVIGGALFGAGTSAWVLRQWRGSAPVGAFIAVLAFALAWGADRILLPNLRTEPLVIRLALLLSHRDTPYHRKP